MTRRLAWATPFALFFLFGSAALGDEPSQGVLDVQSQSDLEGSFVVQGLDEAPESVFETSAQCLERREREKSAGNDAVTGGKVAQAHAAGLDIESCRTSCDHHAAGANEMWLGKAPACNASNQVKTCDNLGGTEVARERCSDGSDSKKQQCCTTGKLLGCLVPRITE